MNKSNPYGYKVCYKEQGCREYARHFLTYTYNQALKARRYYRKYPQKSREDNHLLKKPNWVIIPVTKSEVKDGIWHEVPFWKQKGLFSFYNKIKTKEIDND